MTGQEQADRLAHRLAYWLTGVTRGSMPHKLGLAGWIRPNCFASPGDRSAAAGLPWHFRAAWLRLKLTDLIPGKGQFR